MTVTDIESIASDFELLDDWEQRYQYLTELGDQLEPMPEDEKTEHNLVKPCMSQVWVFAYKDPESHDKILFHGDCDTVVIKGVIGLLVQLFSGRTADDIQAMNVDELFEKIKLAENLSPNRHVGIYAIVAVMKAQVAQLLSQDK